MALITKEELLKLARMSHLTLDEQEIPGLLEQLSAVLNYAERVNSIVQTADAIQQPVKNSNVFRNDSARNTPSGPIIAQAPEHEGNYFVVPMILEK